MDRRLFAALVTGDQKRADSTRGTEEEEDLAAVVVAGLLYRNSSSETEGEREIVIENFVADPLPLPCYENMAGH